MIQSEAFKVGDQVRARDSDGFLVIRETETRYGRTLYRVTEVETLADDVGNSWWVSHDELQRCENNSGGVG